MSKLRVPRRVPSREELRDARTREADVLLAVVRRVHRRACDGDDRALDDLRDAVERLSRRPLEETGVAGAPTLAQLAKNIFSTIAENPRTPTVKVARAILMMCVANPIVADRKAARGGAVAPAPVYKQPNDLTWAKIEAALNSENDPKLKTRAVLRALGYDPEKVANLFKSPARKST